MLNTDELLLLNQTREKFYAKDWKYGEVFDCNFVDYLTYDGTSFFECISLAKEDTETYIFLEGSAPDGMTHTPRHFDA